VDKDVDEGRSRPLISRDLYVDLDGTLIRTDMSAESLIDFICRRPLEIWRVLFWCLRGRAYAKARLAEDYEPDIELLPMQTEFADFVAAQQCRVVLASGTTTSIVSAIAARHGFDGVIASDANENTVGQSKLRRIIEDSGGRPWAYAGNAHIDVALFREAAEALVVNPSPGLAARMRKLGIEYHQFEDRRGMFARWSLVLALGKWKINLAVFLAPLLAAALVGFSPGMEYIVAFFALALATSFAGLVDGLLNARGDRRDEYRRDGPLARGECHPGIALAMAILVGVAATTLSFMLDMLFGVLTLAIMLAACTIAARGPNAEISSWSAVLARLFAGLLLL
jgi:hypothetical protein